ncbi:MAG: hypothetical protein IKM66_04720 [Clostridia bacterium]|nr:hypothetical protein [Clostridia bacterium]
MDNTYLIKKAYELLERVTPLTYDCGKLCDGECCKGDGNTGMWLFPYEEEIIKNIDGFEIKECDGNMGNKMVVCQGSCDRKTRPLACRIYPFFPMITDDGYDVRADIRGISGCPLLYKNIKADYAFIRQVRKIARLFDRDETLKNYINNINSMLDEIENFAKEMTDEQIY